MARPIKTTFGGAKHGYSDKPLAQKLGLKPDMAMIAIAAPAHYQALVVEPQVPAAASPPRTGVFDFVHVFVRDTAELAKLLPQLGSRLATGGMIWVSWPKKASPMFRDLTEDGVRAVALPLGLVDVKVCAVDADWSGLKLLRRRA